jgi:ribosomal protein L7/L12
MAEQFSVTVEHTGTWEMSEHLRGVVVSFMEAVKAANEHGVNFTPYHGGASHEPTVPLITNVGPKKIMVIKELRAFYGISLRDAKELSEKLTPIRLGVVPYYKALELKKLLLEVGATVEVPNALERLAGI